MHSTITNVLRALPFYGVDLPLPPPSIPAYLMRHPEHLEIRHHQGQFRSDGGFIGEATESWGDWVFMELPFYGVDLPLAEYEDHDDHDVYVAIDATFQMARRKNVGVFYDVYVITFLRTSQNFLFGTLALSCGFGQPNENLKSERDMSDTGVESPFGNY
ncbi:hypothetical protein B0H16DRAFT_1765444 [Mycena metata]|uniref:Uncharacterized protein n=1 Tax=Mycena metata TaxID=1033252 RepID=A0AAD7I6L3_9AGAR|nr:hypothetical protein B0H16DRAFT_1765444 [Mycena metata]